MRLTLLFAAFISVALSAAAAPDGGKIDSLTGLKGKLNEKEDVYRVSFPRSDVKVAVDGSTTPPFMGLGTWAAFTGTDADTLMMGDTVVFEDEVNPVISVAFGNGLSVTALHNHFFFDQPKVYFMHIEGHGPVEQVAAAVRKVYDKVREVRAANPQPATSFGNKPLPTPSSISPAPLNSAFNATGEVNNGMVKFVFGRPSTMHGMKIDKDMGVNTWAAFAGTDQDAMVDGDFAVTEDELQPSLKTLRDGNINIVAIHSHMTHETPRIMFFHYWGRGPAKELAQTIRNALSNIGGTKPADASR